MGDSNMLRIDLNGPQGNAFVLLGYARDMARQLNFESKVIEDKMTSGDYENLLDVFYEYFGDFIDWNRDEEDDFYIFE
jgi:hypothetical protein